MKKCSHCQQLKNETEFHKNRSTATGLQNLCKVCQNESWINWKNRHPEVRRATEKRQREPGGCKRAYLQAHKPKVQSYMQDYRKAHLDKWRVNKHNRRAREAAVEGQFTDKEWLALCEESGNVCLCCGKALPLVADHIIPVIRGGTNWIENIQPLCQPCNRAKWMDAVDYRLGVVTKRKPHEKAYDLSSFNTREKFVKAVGQLAGETIDALARRAATEGGLVFWGDATTLTHSTRVTLVPTTSTDKITAGALQLAQAFIGGWQGNLLEGGLGMCIMSPFQYNDLMNLSGSSVLLRQGYTESGAKQLFNYEMGTLAGFKLIVSPYSKVFYGAGTAKNYSDTLSAAIAAGVKTCEVTTNTTNLAAGEWATIGTVQTAAETDATIVTEVVYVTSVTGTTINFIGSGPNGGTKYPHAVLAPVVDSYSVHCATIGGPNSLAKAYVPHYKEDGQLVPPFRTGNAEQWENISFKWLGGYGRLNENWLFRIESAVTGQ